MNMDTIFKFFCDNKEWLFSGLGITVFGVIFKFVFKGREKNNPGNIDTIGNNYNSNNVNTKCVNGNGNIAGYNNTATTNNYYGTFPADEKKETSWFSKQFDILLESLNQARGPREKEYTVEYIGSLLGLENINELKDYLTKDIEPNNAFKRKFIDAFGVNEDWIVNNRGEYPFASNLSFSGNNPMDILRKENLQNIDKFILVVGDIEGKKYICIIRKRGELCYELYSKPFIFNSCVGTEGTRNLVELYRFIRESDNINKLDRNVYEATASQMSQLMEGQFSPKKVEQFNIIRDFVDDFLDISNTEYKSGQNQLGRDYIEVKKIVATNLNRYDEIDQINDLNTIKTNLTNGKYTETESKDNIDEQTSTVFFDQRFRDAFPGIREITIFEDPEKCIERLKVLLKKPLSGKTLKDPIWCLRGTRNTEVNKFKEVSKDKFLLNDLDEIKVKRILVFPANEYYKKFVYVEAFAEEPTGLYPHNEERKENSQNGFLTEEYAIHNGEKITKEEAYDGAIWKDGKHIYLNDNVEYRLRYITPYNFIICAKYNPINKSENDGKLKCLLDGILNDQNSTDELIEFVESLVKHPKDI